jgi:ribosomal protein L11 methyltransferase
MRIRAGNLPAGMHPATGGFPIAGKRNMQQQNDTWIRLMLTAPPELADALSNFLAESGAEGIFQEEAVNLTMAPDEVQSGEPRPGTTAARTQETFQAFIPDDVQAEERIASIRDYLRNLSDLFPDLEPVGLATERITDPGWGEEWKKYFKPFRAGRHMVIKPTWESHSPRRGDTIIEIDPGMAFGTGQHPSTLMCLESIEDILADNPAAGESVLDVGTGTGILGIAAAKLGAKRVVCIDIDEKAVKIARENAIINRVDAFLEIREGSPSVLRGSFGLIAANITSGPLIRMRGDFLPLLQSGGFLVISGILEQDREETERHFLAPPFRPYRLRREKEWLCYVLRKEGSTP